MHKQILPLSLFSLLLMHPSEWLLEDKVRSKLILGIFWIATIPYADWSVPAVLPSQLAWIRGQQEIGVGGYHHWQLVAAFTTKQTLAQAKRCFSPQSHLELTRSEHAADYVWKEDTAVEGSRFELGTKPIRRNAPVDWEVIYM